MNAPFIPDPNPIHLRIQNGSHTVLLCTPSFLAKGHLTASLEEAFAVTCPACINAMTDTEAMEAIERMNHRGSPMR